MCDVTAPRRPQPRWASLYAIAVGSVGLVALAQSLTLVAWRSSLSTAIVIAAGVASVAWVHGNRVALDQRQWCACAPASVHVRVVPAAASFAAAVAPLAMEAPLPLDAARGEAVTTSGATLVA